MQNISETVIKSRTDEELEQATRGLAQAWKISFGNTRIHARSIIRTPFSGGTIALSDSRPDHFVERDARILERFAEAISHSYTRYQDFQRLEQRNRELEIERGIERIQNAVQAMQQSAART